MFRTAMLSICAGLILATASVAVAENVALRAANGRFLRMADDGTIRAESFIPSDKETFELVLRGQRDVILKGLGGRYLMPDAVDGHTPRLGAAGTQPTDRETFELVPVGASRFALRPHGSNALLVFTPAVEHPARPKTPSDPARRETVEIYRIGELPAILKTALPAVIRTLATEELSGKQYDKTQKHKTEKYIDLPAPTLKDPTRMKRHQVIGITEEYRIQAQLDGQADIRIPAMSFLANYADGGPGLILLAVDASLPVRGRVQCKVRDVASASTGYQMTVQLSAVAEVTVRHTGNDVTFGPPTVSDLHVSVSRLEFSNDLLEAVRREIRHLLNHELARNEGRIRESANHALQKAISSREVRIPLIGYLRLL
ncbi:MAG: fascin domain-containing protein [Thermoguttaceae bacterium]